MDLAKPSDLFTDEQIEIIRVTYCNNATREEFWLFMETCTRLRLSPIAGQIHFVKRWDSARGALVGRAQVSIDGFRLVAARTGEYEGQTDGQWCDWDGRWHDVWLSREPPAAARIGVYRRGQRQALTRVATLDEYCQYNKQGQPTQMWARMPRVMLLKCAEAAALRAAFPNELSGVYTDVEMQQAETPDAEPVSYQVQPAALPAPDNVVQLHVANASEADALTGTVVQMFGTKLRQRRTREELVDWCLQVRREQHPEHVKKVLWGMMRGHARALGYSPVEIADQVEAAQ